MDGLIAGSRGGKTTSKDGRVYYRWQIEVGRQHPRRQHPRMDGLSLAVEVGRQHRMDGLIAGSRGGKTTSKDGRVYGWQ